MQCNVMSRNVSRHYIIYTYNQDESTLFDDDANWGVFHPPREMDFVKVAMGPPFEMGGAETFGML